MLRRMAEFGLTADTCSCARAAAICEAEDHPDQTAKILQAWSSSRDGLRAIYEEVRWPTAI